MNILAINWRCIKNPEMGGAEIHFQEIFKRIVAKGHSVTLTSHKFDGAPETENIDGIDIIRIGNKYLFDQQFKKFYLSQLKIQNFDLVVDDISKIPLNTPKYIDKPIIGILHHIHGNSLYKEVPFPIAYYVARKEKQIPKYYNETPIFTVSNSTKSELVKLGFDESKTGILYNAIDQDLFNSIKVEKSDTPLISYVGRIKKYKNIDQIIDAVSILVQTIPDLKFLIGGKGDNLENLKKKVSDLNLDKNIEFIGYLSEEKKAEILGKSWLFVTMAEKEGWGITVIEANAMKTPAIGSDVPGLRDSIKNGETGYLVPLGNSKSLAQKIEKIIKNKDELSRLSNNAFVWSKNFSWNNSADHFLEKIGEWYPELKEKI
ncbi:MAG: glycosyltransferase family 4 protein [Ignavibacteriales bacterium]|nr:glycosyltransferase family 4 protein [Ignavibacteriales bacterium]